MAFPDSRHRYMSGPIELNIKYDQGTAPFGDEYVGWARAVPEIADTDDGWIIQKTLFTGDHLDEIKVRYGKWSERVALFS